MYSKEDCIRTYTGIDINVLDPNINDISIIDITHALSFQCRYGAHVPDFYSVAQHCCLAAELVPDEEKFPTLMHDSSEAFIQDICSPLKRKLSQYLAIEDKWMSVISKKFNFEYPLSETVKMADKKMFEKEWNCLMLQLNDDIKLWTPREAEQEFLRRFKLYSKLNEKQKVS